ncbi:hypothetical protein [Ulvibacter litoralis]|uniref:Uncharacterized protein n=1 Tax=Ulvibacter litoralis TaxID=227084 RepID=A0A1G7J238_9FLAO|nr:hypothetical protein [Ulvibacter litoralis]GHC60564.1 hypothetical protein GCM10008083_26940 [Ulvibacter litoralis]SDF19047.1 hypothetical protein SAMN05421855_10853 [Ulvibacter litoralis]
MITVKVTYTVKPDFVQKNQENINLFMTDFKKWTLMNSATVPMCVETAKHLFTYLITKMRTFKKKMLQVPSFLSFQKQRDESSLEGLPEIEVMEVVASSYDIFKF